MTERPDKWELPEALRLTPEQLAACEADRRKLVERAQRPHAQTSPQERERERGHRLASDLSAAVAHLRAQLAACPPERLPALEEALRVNLEGLAEAHALTGRFDLAAEAAPDRRERARYLRWWRAVWRSDDHWCACPPDTAGRPRRFVRRDVWSVRHNAVRPLLACADCPCVNVAEAPEDVAHARAARREAAAAAAGLSPEDAREALAARNLTTKGVLG